MTEPTSLHATSFPLDAGALSPILTPVDSSDDENGQTHNHSPAFRQWREGKASSPNRRPSVLILDTSMDIDMAEPQPLIHGDNLSPWPPSTNHKGNARLQPSPIPHHLINQSLTISGGRTATPIYDHFTINMRPARMQEERQTADPSESTIKSHLLEPKDESLWWRRRRLPSPVSEAGDVVSERMTETMDTQDNVVDFPDKEKAEKTSGWSNLEPSMEVDGQEHSTQWLTVPGQCRATAAHMTEASAQSHSSTLELTPAPNPANAEQTLTRAKSKISFTMGYRADCEKCRLKVPGHYSHIVRS